jgi:alpha-tubulin suppressor-like RCC1 family protein
VADAFLPGLVPDAQSGTSRQSRVVQVAGGENHSCALTGDGRVLMWGSAELGKLGLGKAHLDTVVRASGATAG